MYPITGLGAASIGVGAAGLGYFLSSSINNHWNIVSENSKPMIQYFNLDTKPSYIWEKSTVYGENFGSLSENRTDLYDFCWNHQYGKGFTNLGSAKECIFEKVTSLFGGIYAQCAGWGINESNKEAPYYSFIAKTYPICSKECGWEGLDGLI